MDLVNEVTNMRIEADALEKHAFGMKSSAEMTFSMASYPNG